MREVDKIALAAFLHDIGKFGQRSDKIEIDDIDWQDFCPRDKNGNPTHLHAAYTAKILGDLIVEKQKENKRIISANSLSGEFIKISAKHHLPESNEEWIVASADRLSSGFEREEFEYYNEIVEEELKKGYKKQKLDHLFIKNRKFPLSKFSCNNIFAVDYESEEEGYEHLWNEFKKELKKIGENFPEHIKIQSLLYLLKKYTSFIPSATSFKYKNRDITKANIPLYEHLKTSSVFASSIGKMYYSNDKKIEKIFAYYKDKKDTLDEKVFVLVAGDFFGIQSFIFNEVQAKYAAKTLRAKSAYIQLLTKVLAYFVCDELDISYYSIISTHAGKFEILAPNFNDIEEKIENIQKKIDEYFLSHFFGQTGVGITYCEVSIGDFILKDKYKQFRKKLADKIENLKYKKFNLTQKGFCIFEIDEGVDNQNLCDFCNKRRGKGEEYKICKDCEKFVKIGGKLTKNRFLAISKKKKEKSDIEIFEGFYLHFFDNVSIKLAKDDIAIFDISNDEEFRGFEKWELSSYVATAGIVNEEEKKYLGDNLEEKDKILTLEELAKLSVREGIENGKRIFGIEAIMSLKGDADGMGNFIKNSDVTNSFAKYNFFARMVDYYFSVYVPIKLMQKKALYTVFAGGDDLFVLGAWDEIINFSKDVRENFIKFTGKNLTFSTGHIISKPNKPINFIASLSEEALEEAKSLCLFREKEIKEDRKSCESKKVKYVYDKEEFCEKNDVSKKDALTLFDESVKWDNYIFVRDRIIKYLENIEDERLNTTFLYRILDLIELSKKVSYECDIKSTIWKSKLNYVYRRNISENDFEFFKILNEFIENYPKELKMCIVEFIYKRRKQ